MRLKDLYKNVDNFQLKKNDDKNINDKKRIIYEDEHYMFYYVNLPLLIPPSSSSILAKSNVVIDVDGFVDRMNNDGVNNTDIIIEFLEYLRTFDIKNDTKMRIKDIIAILKYNHGGYTSWFIPSEKQINDIILDNLDIKAGRVLSSNISYENDRIMFKYYRINGFGGSDNLHVPVKKEALLLGQILLMRYK